MSINPVAAQTAQESEPHGARLVSDRPAGTVTFLFTDIEGSTRLLQQVGEQYPALLAEHQRLLREVWTAYEGYEVDTQGDSFFVAFQEADLAVAAAVTAQRAIAAHRWPAGARLGVRMGLHTGEPMLSTTGYVGIDVHRAARIAAAGHGGQVLLSQRTSDLVQRHLPNDVRVRDLAAHRLKDLARPERIFQLVADGLPADFPPLKVPDSLDGHYEMVARAICEGRIVLFFGTGVNLCGRPAAKVWQPGQADCLPSEAELAAHLARNFDYPEHLSRDLARVSQYVAVTQGLGPLYDELHALLDADYTPTEAHEFAANIPATLRGLGHPRPYQLIVTTNYDDVLERAFQAAGEPYDLVSYVAEGEQRGRFVHWTADGNVQVIERPNEYRALSLSERSVILKIHGAVDRAHALWDSFVITEDHYIEFLSRTDVSNLLPVTLAAKLRRSHYLFLGYRLRDWNLRVILYRIWGQQSLTYKSWAVHTDTQSLDREFWRKREVDSLNVNLADYIGALHERVAMPPLQREAAG